MHPDSAAPLVFIFSLYGFFIALGLASFVLWIVALVDVTRRQFKDPNDRMVWVLVVALAHGIGAIIYMVAGKHKGWLPGEPPLA